MEVTIKIEGLDQLTEAIAMLGGDTSEIRHRSAEEAADAVEAGTTKKEEKPEEEEEAAPVYTLEALQAAAVELARSGKRDDLAAALAECGAETLPKLSEDKFNVFAEKLKALGANL